MNGPVLAEPRRWMSSIPTAGAGRLRPARVPKAFRSPFRSPRASVAARLPRAARGERGSGSVLALAIIGVTLSLLTSAVLLGTVVLATHRARAAADLSALAAATRLLRGADERTVCRTAHSVAARNGARVTECRTRGAVGGAVGGSGGGAPGGGAGARVLGSPGSVSIRTAVSLPAPLTALGPARARAEAGTPEAAEARP